LVTTNTPKLFRSEPIRAELTTVMDSFPSEDDQRFYISQHPVVFRARNLIRNRTVRCALCAFYEWSPIVNTHKLKHCSHRDEAGEVHPWLNMFRHYRARLWTRSSMLPLSIPNHAMLANCIPRENGFKVWQRYGGTRKRRSLLVLRSTVHLGQSDAAICSIVYGISGKGERRLCEPSSAIRC
jgi:hypothetical protein